MNEKLKKYFYVIIIIFLCAIFGVVIFSLEKSETTMNDDIVIERNSDILSLENDTSEEESVIYYVDIKGEVIKPGVYKINSNKRIIDVIDLAGGLTKNADTSLLNLSKKITDEMNIKIYSKKEVQDAIGKINKKPEVIEIIKEIEKECLCPSVNDICVDKNDAVLDKEDVLVDSEINTKDEYSENIIININTASKDELTNIPGIGEAKALKIIEYRENNKFTKIEDILNVSGIGESVFEKIKDYITV